jgi:hypothetical protein
MGKPQNGALHQSAALEESSTLNLLLKSFQNPLFQNGGFQGQKRPCGGAPFKRGMAENAPSPAWQPVARSIRRFSSVLPEAKMFAACISFPTLFGYR